MELLLLGVFFKTTFTQWSVYGHYDCVFLNIVFFYSLLRYTGFMSVSLTSHKQLLLFIYTSLNERYIMTHALLGHESAI